MNSCAWMETCFFIYFTFEFDKGIGFQASENPNFLPMINPTTTQSHQRVTPNSLEMEIFMFTCESTIHVPTIIREACP